MSSSPSNSFRFVVWPSRAAGARGGCANREYSYPSLRQDADGTLHLAYTVFRQHIRHVRLGILPRS